MDAEMNGVAGVMKITFVIDISKQELLEKFSECMFLTGSINLVNEQGEETDLDVHSIEYVEFDEDSDYLVDGRRYEFEDYRIIYSVVDEEEVFHLYNKISENSHQISSEHVDELSGSHASETALKNLLIKVERDAIENL